MTNLSKKIFVFLLLLVVFSFIIHIYFPLRADTPPANLSITIPDYNVEEINGFHHATIPDGKLMSVFGKPEIPYYSVSINYEKNYKVQNVEIVERSGMSTDEGLNIPVVITEKETERLLETNEWYPSEDINWSIDENPNDTTTLNISLFPFFYNPSTKQVNFYKKYEIKIDYIYSSIFIDNISSENSESDSGVFINFDVKSTDVKVRDLIAGVTINREDSTLVESLPIKELSEVSGESSVTIKWDNSTGLTGPFYAEAEIRDLSNNILDKKKTYFSCGYSMLTIENYSVTPEKFKTGDYIDISADLLNNGNIPIKADLMVKISDEGNIIKEFTKDSISIENGKRYHLAIEWDTNELQEGRKYLVTILAYYDGGSTDAISKTVSNNQPPKAEFDYEPKRITYSVG